MKYGWKKDLPDHRDFKFTYQVMSLPQKVDLRPEMPPVYDQGELGSCTANAGGAAFAYTHKKEQKLLLADVTLPEEREIDAMRSPRWTR